MRRVALSIMIALFGFEAAHANQARALKDQHKNAMEHDIVVCSNSEIDHVELLKKVVAEFKPDSDIRIIKAEEVDEYELNQPGYVYFADKFDQNYPCLDVHPKLKELVREMENQTGKTRTFDLPGIPKFESSESTCFGSLNFNEYPNIVAGFFTEINSGCFADFYEYVTSLGQNKIDNFIEQLVRSNAHE